MADLITHVMNADRSRSLPFHCLLVLLLVSAEFRVVLAADSEAIEQYAYLQNHYEVRGRSGFAYLFQHANEKRLSSGFFELKIHGPRDLRHTIPAGETVLGVRINYFPESPRFPYAMEPPFHYKIIVRDRGGMYPNQRMTEEERESFKGRSGIRFNAEPGETYRIASRIEDGMIRIWIEVADGESAGKKVSDSVLGLMEGGWSAEIWGIWKNLPDPVE